MKILFLSRFFPYPPNNGAKIRVFNILKQLSTRHEIVLLTFWEGTDAVDSSTLDTLREYCAEVEALPYPGYHPSSARAIAGFLSTWPRYLVATHSRAMEDAVAREIAANPQDLIVVSGLDMASYALASTGIPRILDQLEVSNFLDRFESSQVALKLEAGITWLKLKSYLRDVLPGVRVCTVVSETEKALVRRAAPFYSAIEVIPNGVDVSWYKGDFGAPEKDSLVFAGAMTYSANLDAVRFFLRDVYPLILEAIPRAQLRVTGSTEGVDLGSLPSLPGVEFTGYVPDIRPVVSQSWVSVVPIRQGAGTKLKIIESMALGTPVVSTSKGAEGLDVQDGHDILIADDPRAFADRTIAILQSPQRREKVAAGGRRLVESQYDWQNVGQALCGLVEQAVTH